MTASTGERVLTPSDLGWRLQVVRAAIWTAAASGDPYALLLRGQEDDPGPWLRRARERGPVHRSALTAWVCTDNGLGAEVLADHRFGTRCADGSPHGLQILPLDEACLGLDGALYGRAAPLLDAARHHDGVRAACDRVLAGWGPGEHDLVVDYALPVTEAVVGLVTGLPEGARARLAGHRYGLGLALDALATPPALAPTMAMFRAVRAARAAFRAAAEGTARAAFRVAEAVDTVDGVGTVGAVTDGAVATALTVVCAATMPTAIARAASGLLDDPTGWAAAADATAAARAAAVSLRRHPPVRLHARVAHEPVSLSTVDIAAGDQVVVVDSPAPGEPSLLDRAGLHCGLAAPLLRLVTETALHALAAACPRVRAAGTPLYARRAPVTGALLSVPVIVEHRR